MTTWPHMLATAPSPLPRALLAELIDRATAPGDLHNLATRPDLTPGLARRLWQRTSAWPTAPVREAAAAALVRSCRTRRELDDVLADLVGQVRQFPDLAHVRLLSGALADLSSGQVTHVLRGRDPLILAGLAAATVNQGDRIAAFHRANAHLSDPGVTVRDRQVAECVLVAVFLDAEPVLQTLLAPSVVTADLAEMLLRGANRRGRRLPVDAGARLLALARSKDLTTEAALPVTTAALTWVQQIALTPSPVWSVALDILGGQPPTYQGAAGAAAAYGAVTR